MGPAQLTDVLRHLPTSSDPNLLVGFETSDDAGVWRLSESEALVQTLDFFTPIVDDPYAYGAIAAANSLSDVYAMGGRPITALNIACFDPDAGPAELWAAIFRGMADTTVASGAAIVGGHTIKDSEPKFGLSVTGLVDPRRMFANTDARVGDGIYLSKPLGTGIVTTAAKRDACEPHELEAAIRTMSTLNADACQAGLAAGVRCATDITGFGLAGHLGNIARASSVRLQIDSGSLPILEGVQRMVDAGMTTGGGANNAAHLGAFLTYAPTVPEWMRHVVVDPQTSGGLALFSATPVPGMARIGEVVSGEPGLHVG